jgi:sec-independent protein translocase protein TatB
MFDIGWSELVVIAVVALIAIGPKELPGVLRMVGQWMGKARKMAAEFQGQFQEAMREAEMADLKKSFDEVRDAASGLVGGNVMTSLQKDGGDALHIGDIDKPATSSEAPATEAPAAMPAIEPPATSSEAPATSSDAPATSSEALASSEAPVNPTTPEPPPPQTIVEAEAHAVTEPINLAPPAAEALKDAKAS